MVVLLLLLLMLHYESQITGQMKILITALFAVLMLGQPLTRTQKISLLLLQTGVIFVQLGQMQSNEDHETTLSEDEANTDFQQYIIGVVAVLAACCSSGFASIYFEKMLKTPSSGQAGL